MSLPWSHTGNGKNYKSIAQLEISSDVLSRRARTLPPKPAHTQVLEPYRFRANRRESFCKQCSGKRTIRDYLEVAREHTRCTYCRSLNRSRHIYNVRSMHSINS